MRLDEDVDVVLSGHSHEFTNQYLPNAGGKPTLVTQAYSYSSAYSDVYLELDPVTKDVTSKNATIIIAYADLGPGLTPDENAQELLDAVNTVVEPLINEIITTTDIPLTRTLDVNGESLLYNIVTDACRWHMDADMSIINIGALGQTLMRERSPPVMSLSHAISWTDKHRADDRKTARSSE